jgi:uncharacterized membrane protein YccC
MVVMSAQTHFGGAVRKASMRFLGTLGGVTTAIAVLWFFGDNILVVFCTIFFASIIFAYIASDHGDISYAGTLGGVTVILVLTGQQISIETAIQRGCYIVVGIVIALLVSRLFFPIHARNRLRYHVATTLRNLSDLYLATIQLKDTNQELTTVIADDIASQQRLIYEAVVGSLEFAAKKSIFTAILSSEHCLSRLINLTYLSVHEAVSATIIKKQLDEAGETHNIIASNLKYLADCFEKDEQPQKVVNLEEILAEITSAAQKLPVVEYSFLFFMEQILKELENMRKLIIKANSKNKDNVV